MVEFTNVNVRGDYIEADAKNLHTGKSCNVTVHISKQEYMVTVMPYTRYFIEALKKLQAIFISDGYLSESYTFSTDLI
jgi:hypothetical protein